MAKLDLRLSIGLSDRTVAIFDGQAPIEGCRVDAVPLVQADAFRRGLEASAFDVTEMSLSSHAAMVAQGDAPYVAVPVFPSRAFRHSAIYIRTDRGIAAPEDLGGRTIGLPEYLQTVNIWIRGILQDEHGVRPGDIHWRVGGLDAPAGERAPVSPPPGIDLQPIPAGRSLSDLLAAGEIDAVFSAREPAAFTAGTPHVGRLFPDYATAEQAWFRRTKIFPIMHVIGIRRELVERQPWLPVSVFKAFAKAKDIAMSELGLIGWLPITLPWPIIQLQRAQALMGKDYWSYGIDANRHTLATFLRYAREQGLIAAALTPESLFAESTLELSKV